MARVATTSPTSARPPSRLVIRDVEPRVDSGTRQIKRVVGEPVEVHATVFADGHDALHVVLAHQQPGRRAWDELAMVATNPGLDRWSARFTPVETGLHRFRILAWIDRFASWQHGTARKLEAGVDVGSDLIAGAALLDGAARALKGVDADALRAAAERLRAGDTIDVTDPGGDRRPSAAELYRRTLRRADAAASEPVEVLVERERALFSTWYELFPRSWSTDPARRPHGTLADVIDQLDYVADLGFDVLYLPPVHPIGSSFRKGKDNAEQAEAGDPGSPWAIGSADGGHTAVHPELGTLDDFRRLVKVADDNGIEVALDIAFQCSPDHPWVTEHPEWFAHRPDGTIQYAENPPKKYQDIYPFDFECDAWESLWHALRDVFRFWIDQGVRIFRVDNPHTKPFAFWQWMIDDLRATTADLIFLSEAFTRPEVMHQLAMVGFTQSYTYFAWRVTKEELTDYFTELSSPPSVDRFRPNAWPTTPDILPWHLQRAPREMNALRGFLAATLSPSYGIYGPSFELADNTPADNGKEEHGASEKYEIRCWDLADPRSLKELIHDLNEARRSQLALHTLRTLRFHEIDNDQLLAYSKTAHDGADVDPSQPARNPVLCVANLDPERTQVATIHVDLDALGVDAARPYQVDDLLTGRGFQWWGAENYIELDPARQPGHLFRVSQR